jgi:KDO2-lipid IV(A) lauroyltransferase
MRNPLATRAFKAHWERCGIEVIEVGPGLRAAFLVLKRGGLLCFAADQDAGRHGVFVDFLGRAASTPSGPVELALRTGAPIVFGLIFRRGSVRGIDHHLVRIDPPLFVEEKGSREETVRHHVQHLSNRLSAGILEQPDQWFWFHRRWKTRPPGEEPATIASA